MYNISISIRRLTATIRSMGVLLLITTLAGCVSPAQVTPTPRAPADNGDTATQVSAVQPASATNLPGSTLKVIATTTQIRSMAEAVAGNSSASSGQVLATVRSIIPPGADPHEFEPKPSDVRAISESALVLKNGVGLDDWVDKIINNAGGQRPLVVVSKGVPIRKGGENEAGGDPHIWFDVTNAMTMTRNIRDAFIQVDGQHAEAYKTNADAYLAKLAGLDKYIMDQVATIPPSQRKMVTNHDAFGYFINRYGLTFVGSIIPSMSTNAQPSANDVTQLIQKIKAEHIKAIFLESSINPSLAKQLGNDAGVKVVDTLYGDSLGGPNTPGGTYESMMRYDADTIVSALK